MKINENIEITNEDNIDLMARYPNNYFDLAIVDPPYSSDVKSLERINTLEGSVKIIKKHKKATPKKYDYNTLTQAPTIEYFKELKRVSKNQIIWGVNWYNFYLGPGRVIWCKNTSGHYSDSEIAYQSFNSIVKNFTYTWNGMLQGDMKNKEERIHPTQKPVKLYEWLLMNYAKQGDKILDTHLGSGSIAIACERLGFNLTACELDKNHYENAIKRIKEQVAQKRLF